MKFREGLAAGGFKRSGAFEIAAYAKNLGNFVNIQSLSVDSAIPGDPRTFGLRIGLHL